MKKDGKWLKVICWMGKVEELECTSHSYAWSGRIPCTGDLRCIYCGKPESEEEQS